MLIAHYYTHPEIQALAEATGGFVGDSLEMAKFGNRHPATTLIIAGVRFMGESAKILTPENASYCRRSKRSAPSILVAQQTSSLSFEMHTLIIL